MAIGPFNAGAARGGLAGMAGAAGAGGAAPKAPMPGSLAGGPSGPGASPVTPSGVGAGNEAMADAVIKAVLPALHKALSAYPIGSPKYQAVLNSIRSLTKNFGKESTGSTVPAALLQIAQAGKSGAPAPQGPPPSIQAAPMAPPGGAGASMQESA